MLASIRQAITTYLQSQIEAGQLPAISTVLGLPSELLTAEIFAPPAEDATPGAAVILWVQRSQSRLYAPPLLYEDRYTLDLIVLARDFTANAVRCQQTADAACDQLRASIKASKTANASNVVWQWGLGNAGGGVPDIVMTMQLPELIQRSNATLVEVRADIMVEVIELTPQQLTS